MDTVAQRLASESLRIAVHNGPTSLRPVVRRLALRLWTLSPAIAVQIRAGPLACPLACASFHALSQDAYVWLGVGNTYTRFPH